MTPELHVKNRCVRQQSKPWKNLLSAKKETIIQSDGFTHKDLKLLRHIIGLWFYWRNKSGVIYLDYKVLKSKLKLSRSKFQDAIYDFCGRGILVPAKQLNGISHPCYSVDLDALREFLDISEAAE